MRMKILRVNMCSSILPMLYCIGNIKGEDLLSYQCLCVRWCKIIANYDNFYLISNRRSEGHRFAVTLSLNQLLGRFLLQIISDHRSLIIILHTIWYPTLWLSLWEFVIVVRSELTLLNFFILQYYELCCLVPTIISLFMYQYV